MYLSFPMDKASFALSLFVVAFQDEIRQVSQKIATETDEPRRQLLQQQLQQAQSNHKHALARHTQLCQVKRRDFVCRFMYLDNADVPGGPLVPFFETTVVHKRRQPDCCHFDQGTRFVTRWFKSQTNCNTRVVVVVEKNVITKMSALVSDEAEWDDGAWEDEIETKNPKQKAMDIDHSEICGGCDARLLFWQSYPFAHVGAAEPLPMSASPHVSHVEMAVDKSLVNNRADAVPAEVLAKFYEHDMVDSDVPSPRCPCECLRCGLPYRRGFEKGSPL